MTIEQTLLKADASAHEVQTLAEESLRNGFRGVCVNPTFVKQVRAILRGSKTLVVSVVGFPLGTHPSNVKALEAATAVADGADEIDMVMRIDLAKAGEWKQVEDDIREVVRAAGHAPVKVILETGFLTADEIKNACRSSEAAGAAFVKTSTGMLGQRGASVEDVRLMRESCSTKMQIKASGGVKTFEQAKALLNAGATRIGTSSGVALVTGTEAKAGY
jgi:deoxyribose-phosphate aldolase